jgi:hypothetical protein
MEHPPLWEASIEAVTAQKVNLIDCLSEIAFWINLYGFIDGLLKKNKFLDNTNY